MRISLINISPAAAWTRIVLLLKKCWIRSVSRLRKGEKVSIIGPNGAGKSTLLLNIAGLADENYREGEIYIYDKKLDRKSIYDIREDIGFVFQDPNDQLFSTRVFDDVAFGLVNFLNKKDNSKAKDRDYIEEIVRISLKKVNMSGVEESIPHFLSFGEKKLVSLATVLSYSPRILILDEPASNLDPGNRNNFIDLIKNMEKTIIVATHDLDMAYDFSDRCIIINDKHIIYDGSSSEVLIPRLLLTPGVDRVRRVTPEMALTALVY